jgi:hypothetical protein
VLARPQRYTVRIARNRRQRDIEQTLHHEAGDQSDAFDDLGHGVQEGVRSFDLRSLRANRKEKDDVQSTA